MKTTKSTSDQTPTFDEPVSSRFWYSYAEIQARLSAAAQEGLFHNTSSVLDQDTRKHFSYSPCIGVALTSNGVNQMLFAAIQRAQKRSHVCHCSGSDMAEKEKRRRTRKLARAGGSTLQSQIYYNPSIVKSESQALRPH